MLLKKRNEVFEQMKAVMNIAADKRSASEYAKYDALEADYSNLTAEIEREVRFGKVEQSLNAVAEKRAISTSGGADEIRSAFHKYLRTGNSDEMRALSTFSTGEGGATIPTYLQDVIVNTLAKEVVARTLPGIRIIQTQSTLDIPIIDTVPTAIWTDEAPSGSYDVGPSGDPVFGKKTLRAYKLAKMLKISNEMLNDTPTNLEGAIAFEAANAFASTEESAFLIGDGSAKPTGIFATSGIGSLTVSGSVSGSQVTDALINLEFSLTPNYRRNAVFVLSDAVLKVARVAKDNYGRYLWQPALILGQPDTFAGRQVFRSQSLPSTLSVGTHGGIVDARFVTIGDRLPYQMLRLNELYAQYGQVGFQFTKRTDCVVTQVNAVSKLVIN